MLDKGSSGTCRYEIRSADGGKLFFPVAFFTPLGESSDGATLELSDGTQRRVRVTFGPRVQEGTFSFMPDTP